MTSSRLRILVLVTASCSLVASACGNSGSSMDLGRIPVVQLAFDSTTVSVGDTVRLALLPMLPPGYVPAVTWSSSDSDVARVEKAGATSALVEGLQAGKAIVTAAGEGSRDSVTVTVTAAGPGS